MTTDVEEFLAHYGKKGMRWGHRKAESTSGPKKKKRKGLTYQQKEMLKVGGVIAVGAAVAVGAHYAKKYIATKEAERTLSSIDFSKYVPNFGSGTTSRVASKIQRPGAIPMPSGDQVRAMQARVKNVPVAKISSYARDAAKIQANPGAYQWLKDASPSAFNALMNVNK